MIKHIKEVRFDLWCDKCKHSKKKETQDPCFDCLAEPKNVDSHKPTKWEKNGDAAEGPKKRSKRRPTTSD